MKQAIEVTLLVEHRTGGITMDTIFFLVAALILLLALGQGEAAARGASAHYRRVE